MSRLSAALPWVAAILISGGAPDPLGASTPPGCVVSLVPDEPVRAGEPTTLRFDVVPTQNGLSVGDRLELYLPHCSPHRGLKWSEPTTDPTLPGFVTAGDHADVTIEPHPHEVLCGDRPIQYAAHLPDLAVLTLQTAVPRGETLRFEYRGGFAQRFPEERATFRMMWRGEGDRWEPVEWNTEPLSVDRAEPRRLHVTGPSQARRGESATIRVAALDEFGFPSRLPTGVRCAARHESGESWGPVAIPASHVDPAVGLLEDVAFPLDGAWWVSASGAELEPGWELPVLVGEDTRALRWGDLHWHTNRSDGSRSPREGYHYAREIVGLDFTAKTDHDFHARQGCMNDSTWAETIELARELDVPGRFTVLVGWEYTWNSGHHNVYFRGLEGPYCPVNVYTAIEEVWDKLRPGNAITIPHHPAATKQPSMDWSHRDGRFQTVVEIYSNKGNSEAPLSPLTIRALNDPRVDFRRPGSVQEGWSTGARFGLIGSTDTHYGVPGTPIRVRNALDDEHLAGPGICALWSDELTRDAVFDALIEGRTYATTGPRIRVEFDASLEEGKLSTCSATVLATAELESIDVIGIPWEGGPPFPVVASVPDVRDRFAVARDLPIERADELRGVYLRVTQRDTQMAWSSPVWAAPATQ